MPSSPAVTPFHSFIHTTLLTVPSCAVAPPVPPKKSGSAFGLLRSKSRTFFSCPPVKRCDVDGEKATLRTMWLWGNECNAAPENVSHIFLESSLDRMSYPKSKATHAVKSALPVAAFDESAESLVLHTAPLCPMKVPIQSPVHSLNIGFPSLQLDTSK